MSVSKYLNVLCLLLFSPGGFILVQVIKVISLNCDSYPLMNQRLMLSFVLYRFVQLDEVCESSNIWAAAQPASLSARRVPVLHYDAYDNAAAGTARLVQSVVRVEAQSVPQPSSAR